MFGNKLRSWMEAVRPRKKQQRKEKQIKVNLMNGNGTISFSQPLGNLSSPEQKMENMDNNSMHNIAPRYSGTNLSSPESAYSTGYSTDGTSPGAPPEYYINIRTGTRYFRPNTSESEKCDKICPEELVPTESFALSREKNCPSNLSPVKQHIISVAVQLENSRRNISMAQEICKIGLLRGNSQFNEIVAHNNIGPRLLEGGLNSNVTSPRQRNRIRTNPWVPGSNLSPGNSSTGLHSRQEFPKALITDSPISDRYLNTTTPCTPVHRDPLLYRKTLSSSSCSSLSTTDSIHRNKHGSKSTCASDDDDDDDCTLNEMMGKYDESYIYEKETDILSDSDPTDCESDIDTGQDGGDEEDPLEEEELDFIDNNCFLEFKGDNIGERENTGHCTYYSFDVQRKLSHRRLTRRFQKQEMYGDTKQMICEKRRRSSCSKKKQKQAPYKMNKVFIDRLDGSKSAGGTPLSSRRTKHNLFKFEFEEQLRKRSNSVCLSKNPVSSFDRRDKEADKKYKELIVEAESILRSMKCNGLSPKRTPVPPNKRVELLRSDINSIVQHENITSAHSSRIPSTNFPRFSPKKNHITNFINHNSPIPISIPPRKDIEKSLPLSLRTSNNVPLSRNKYISSKPETRIKRSPKYRKKSKHCNSQQKKACYSSDSESDCTQKDILSTRNNVLNQFVCPQSEPVKRKIYSKRRESEVLSYNSRKTVLGISDNDSTCRGEHQSNCEHLRHQVLLNTITNLKRSLEDQSESLKQIYRSTHDIHL